MKRLILLISLVILVAWLALGAQASGTPEPGKSPAAGTATAAAAPDDSCCANPGETDPHWECLAGTCYQVSTCGYSVDCSTCGCDPFDEWSCINSGGYWDPNTCSCDYSCDPTGWEQQQCISQGRTWDALHCICTDTNVCLCDDPVLINTDTYSYSYCDGYSINYCEDVVYTYAINCESPCGYSQFTHEESSCFTFGEYCGSSGGGGGDCWEDGTCWCDFDWGYCCDDDGYCYEIEVTES